MDIGSAKITKEEMDKIPHYLIDCLEPFQDFNVVNFQKLAKEAMEKIWEKGKIPIITGGTGFYIQSVLYNIDFTENSDNAIIRKKLEDMAIEKGGIYLHNKLKVIDPKAAEEIHENNIKRVIRALEFFELTGKKISEHNELQKTNESPYDFRYFVLNDHREDLYKRIDQRVDEMISKGLINEVTGLKEMGLDRTYISMQGIGYKEILSYLEGEISLEEAVYIIKRDTRHFAKRQLTWFKRERDVIWMNKYDFEYNNEKILEFMVKRINDVK